MASLVGHTENVVWFTAPGIICFTNFCFWLLLALSWVYLFSSLWYIYVKLRSKSMLKWELSKWDRSSMEKSVSCPLIMHPSWCAHGWRFTLAKWGGQPSIKWSWACVYQGLFQSITNFCINISNPILDTPKPQYEIKIRSWILQRPQ
jgi:hypothetical protein